MTTQQYYWIAFGLFWAVNIAYCIITYRKTVKGK